MFRAIAGSVCALIFATASAAQNVLPVPSASYPTIQSAINAAGPAVDIISVAPGTYFENIDVLGKDVQLVGNGNPTINGSGSGVVVNFSPGSSSLCRMTGFTIANGAKGVRVLSSSPVIVDCTITGNVSPAAGGQGVGVDVFANVGAADPQFLQCRIIGNDGTAGTTGAGVACAAAPGFVAHPFFISCLITDNASQQAGAIYNFRSNAEYLFCTITNNSGASSAVNHVGGNSACVYRNTIIWGNTGFSNVGGENAAITAEHCDIGEPWNGAGFGNFNADPQFASPGTGDYHLMIGSPCIDAGINNPVVNPFDFEFQPRQVGTTVDVGADEVACRHPGSGEDLQLATFVDGSGGSEVCYRTAMAGQVLTLEMTSPGGTFAADTPLMGLNLTTDPNALTPFGFLNIQLDLSQLALLFDGESALGLYILGNGLTLNVSVPASLAGFTARVQGVLTSGLATSGIATTNAHDVAFQ